MEDIPQQEKQELEYKDPNEEQGGIRRRLRDRELLRKRKAEAEERETNQLESQRKRSKADDKRGTKKRGRPRKTEATLQTAAVQEEAAVVVVPESAEVIPDQIAGSLTPFLPVQLQPAPVPAHPVPVPVLESVPVFAPTLTSPTPIEPTLDTALVQVGGPASVQNMGPAPVQVMAPPLESNSVPDLSRDSVPDAALDPPAPCPIYTEPQSRGAFDQVLIEDLGPDEEADISPSQDKRADEDVSETLSINVPVYSFPTTLSSQPLPQEYLPGN